MNPTTMQEIVAMLRSERVMLMHESHHHALLSRILETSQVFARGDHALAAGMAAVPSASINAPRDLTAGSVIACIPIQGVLNKNWDYCGMCSTTRVIEQVEASVADPTVSTIVLDIDSPGGFVNGSVELADVVHAATAVKPVIAIVRGLCCSGAFWIASQCTRIISRPESEVGNIGVYSVLIDWTKYMEMLGVTTTLVASGPNKGLGADGKVTDALVADTKRINTGLFNQFVAAVADGRKLDTSRALELADGKAFLGSQALSLGLVDAVASTFDAAIEAATTGAADAPERTAMGKTDTKLVSAVAAVAAAAAAAAPPLSAKKADDESDGNDSARKVLTATIESAKSHRNQIRAAMDHAAESGDVDDETKKHARKAVSAIKATSEEAGRCAKAWLSLAGEGDDDPDDDDDKDKPGDGGSEEDKSKAAAAVTAPTIGATAQEFVAAFGDAGARWFIENKSFAAATTEYVSQLKTAHKAEVDRLTAENADLKKRLAAMPRGNDEALASVSPDTKTGPSAAHARNGLSPALAQFANSIKMPTEASVMKLPDKK